MEKLYCLLLALYPITSGYGLSPQVDFGSLMLLLVGVIIFVQNGMSKVQYPLGYKPFMLAGIIISILFVTHIPFRLILFSINLVLACSFVSWDTFWQYYRKIVIASCLFFLAQEVASSLLNHHISGILTFIPTIYGYASSSNTLEALQNSGRSSSFFLEPSYFAQFLFPFVALNLFQEDKKSIHSAILVSGVLLLTKSGNGVALLLIIWGAWFIYSKISVGKKITSIVAVSIVLGMVMYYQPDLIETFSKRSSELTSYSGNEEHMSSGFMRFFRGYYLIADLSFRDFLFGTTPSEIEQYMSQNIYFAFTEDKMINGLQTAITSHGIIVALLYIYHLLKYTSGLRKNKAGLVMCLCFIYLMLSESYFLCGRSVLTTVFLFCMYKHLYSNSNDDMIESNIAS